MGTHDGAGHETGQEEAGFAFNEFDKNKDKKVAWEEWEALMSSPHPGGNPGANLKSISPRYYLREVAS